MRRTGAAGLIVAAILGAGVGYLVDHVLTVAGRATFTPSIMLPVLLVALGALCLVLALPIRRAVRDPKAPRIDPFRALRVAVLAKASSIVGAVMAGGAAGLIVFALTRPVAVGLGSIGTTIATVIGGVVLLIAALVAEYLCTLPKDPDERHSDAPGAEPDPR